MTVRGVWKRRVEKKRGETVGVCGRGVLRRREVRQ